MDIPDPTSLNLTSVAGIAAITVFIVELLKRPLGRCKFLKKVPVFIYSMIIAAILAYLANRVLHWLSGNIYIIMGHSILSAASSSGLYTWLKNPEKMETATKIGGKQCSKD